MEFLKNIFGGLLAPMQETLIPIFIIFALVAGAVLLINIFFKRDDYEDFYADFNEGEKKQTRAEKRAEAKAKRAEAKAQKAAVAKNKKGKSKDKTAKDLPSAAAPLLTGDVESASDSGSGESAPAALLQRANMHMAAGDLDKAEQVFLAINKHRPSDMDAVKSLLSIYGERKDVEKFSNTYESAMRLLQTRSDTLGDQQTLETIKTRFFSPDVDPEDIPSAMESVAMDTNMDLAADDSWLSEAQHDAPDFGDQSVVDSASVTPSLSAESVAKSKPAARTRPMAKTADEIQTEGKPQYEQTLIKRFQNKDFNATVLLLTMYGNRQDQLSFDEVFPIAADHVKEGNNQTAEMAQLEQLRDRYFAGMEAATGETEAVVPPVEETPAVNIVEEMVDDALSLDIDEMPDFSDIDDMLESNGSDDGTMALLEGMDLGEPEFMSLDAATPSASDDIESMDALGLGDLEAPEFADASALEAAEEEKLFADFDMLMDNEAILMDMSDDDLPSESVATDGLAAEAPAVSASRLAKLEADSGDADIRHREIHHDDPEEELYYLNETRIEFAETMLRADNQLAAMQLFEKVLESGDKRHSDSVKEKIIKMLG